MFDGVGNLVGLGIYTPAEAAYFARISTQTMVRWVHGNRAGGSVIHPELAGDEQRTVTFLDFVQALAIRAIRREFKVPLQRIREAVDHARERYRVEYPFAMQHRTCLFDRDIHIVLPGRKDLVQVSGKGKDQIVAHQIAEPFIADLTFGDDELATAYLAYQWRNRSIVINPMRRFGQPIVDPSGHAVYALLGAYRAERSVEAAAEAYATEPDDVLAAVAYDDLLRRTTAA